MATKSPPTELEMGPTGRCVADGIREYRLKSKLSFADVEKRLTEAGHRIHALDVNAVPVQEVGPLAGPAAHVEHFAPEGGRPGQDVLLVNDVGIFHAPDRINVLTHTRRIGLANGLDSHGPILSP